MTHLCTTHPHLCPTCWRCDDCCTCYEDHVAELAAVLMLGPDLEAVQPAGEWNRTVARGYARRILAAGYRRLDVPARVEPDDPPLTAPRAGTQTREASDG